MKFFEKTDFGEKFNQAIEELVHTGDNHFKGSEEDIGGWILHKNDIEDFSWITFNQFEF